MSKILRNKTRAAVTIGGLVIPVGGVAELTESHVRALRRRYPERLFPEVDPAELEDLEETRGFTLGESDEVIGFIEPVDD